MHGLRAERRCRPGVADNIAPVDRRCRRLLAHHRRPVARSRSRRHPAVCRGPPTEILACAPLGGLRTASSADGMDRGRPGPRHPGARPQARLSRLSRGVPGSHARAGRRHGRRPLGPVTIAPEGRKLLRVEARNAETPHRAQACVDPHHRQDGAAIHRDRQDGQGRSACTPSARKLVPTSLSAGRSRGYLPHRWRHLHAALRLRDIATGRLQPLDPDERDGVAESVKSMGLREPDRHGRGARRQPGWRRSLYAATIRAIHELNPNTGSRSCRRTPGACLELVGH